MNHYSRTGVSRVFPDGTSLTLLIVEARQAVPWTKPADLLFDPKQPLPVLGAFADKVVPAVFADTSCLVLPPNIQAGDLRALITRNGGENALKIVKGFAGSK
jgi:hypothetical protein